MAEDLTTKILDVRPIAVFDAKTGFTAGMQIDFNVGTHGPYSYQMKQTDYSAASAKAAVEKMATEIRATLT